MLFRVACFWLFSVVFLPFIASVQREGDNCVLSIDGTPGVCKKARDCPEAFSNPADRPDLCMYTPDQAIICCPNDEEPTLVEKHGEIGANQGERISGKKCTEYSKLATKQFSVTSLVAEPDLYDVTVPDCDFTTPLIVDGEKAKPGEFPHMAALGWEDDGKVDYVCGGALISDEYVLTAAHCFVTFRGNPTVVRLGDHNLVSDSDGVEYQDIQIRRIVQHPNYKRPSKYNDIAIIQLATKAKFGQFVRPACLWQTHNVNYTEVVATGWGITEFAGEKSNELLKVRLYFYNHEECEITYQQDPKNLAKGVIDSQVCVGNRNGTRGDTCQGDSGGPIQVIAKNSCIFYIIGITSYGKGCGFSNIPAIYTRVSSYIDWIESIVWPNGV